MSTVIEARRLNGTDIGKTVEFLDVIKGALASVHHGVITVEEKTIAEPESTLVKIPVVDIRMEGRDAEWRLYPSTKVTISGKESKP